MNLENNLYNIVGIQKTSSGFVGIVEICSDHPIYSGHFPGHAVVPGVCTLAIVKDCLGKFLGRQIILSDIKECKFVAALLPDHPLRLEICFEMKEACSFRCQVQCEDKTILKIKATYAENI